VSLFVFIVTWIGCRISLRRIYYILLLSLLCACASPESAQQKLARELDNYFKQRIPADEPGVAVLIAKGDHILFSRGYGLSDMTTKEPITTKTLFNLGSISKTFVSNAILVLQEQGKLSVEDPIFHYFPDFKNKTFAQKIKIKHLLSHTSGLPDNRQVSKDTLFYLTARDAENWYPVTQTDTLVFEPGTRYEYSNPSFNGLALIVEQVSGMKWQKFVEENIFKPAGMTASTITDGPYPETGVAHAYEKINGQGREDDYGEEPTFAAAGNGGVWSSVEELAKYNKALRNAVFLKPEAIAQSHTVFFPPNWAGQDPPSRGWSWEIGKTPDGWKTVEHHGDQGGFICNFVTVPEKGILFVILCNSRRDEPRFSLHVLEELQKMNWGSE
jgi:CubicO group peptidase (beta-lactamase class C family)